MSRLGDMLKKERLSRGLSPKQVAKLCGVKENYLVDVEDGRRIISDGDAAHMLKRMGVSADVSSDMGVELEAALAPESVSASVGHPKPPAQARAEAVAAQAVASDDWLDALKSVLRRVPVYSEGGTTVSMRNVAAVGGTIEGAAADKVFYFQLPDDALSGQRLLKGDLLLCVPPAPTDDDRLMVVKLRGLVCARRVKRLEGNRYLLMTLDRDMHSQTVATADVTLMGRAIRAEIEI